MTCHPIETRHSEINGLKKKKEEEEIHLDCSCCEDNGYSQVKATFKVILNFCTRKY